MTEVRTKLRSDLHKKLRREEANLTHATHQSEWRTQLTEALSGATAVLYAGILSQWSTETRLTTRERQLLP